MSTVKGDFDRISVLQDAFRLFDRSAETLQEAYRALIERAERLDVQLASSNAALRRNLEENEEIKAHLTTILESLSTGVIVTDAGEIVVRCNHAAEILLGMDRGEMLGRPLSDLLQRAQLDADRYPAVSPTGAMLVVSRTVLGNAPDCPAGHIVLLHDVSTVRKLEERLQRRNRLAAMGEMVGRIAHEIRNPLGSVELFASMLRKDLIHDPESRRYAEHISAAVDAMNRLLTNLLTYTRPDCSRADRYEIKPLLEEVLVLGAHEIARHAVSVRLAIEPTVDEVWCDAAQLKQALLNLCVNAAQAMPTGGTLSIVVSRDAESRTESASVRIAIADTGRGIDPALLPRIFDPFFTTRDEGTGLGLAIVHAIVEAHQGRIEVESHPGGGSTFIVLLPDRSPSGDRSGSANFTARAD